MGCFFFDMVCCAGPYSPFFFQTPARRMGECGAGVSCSKSPPPIAWNYTDFISLYKPTHHPIPLFHISPFPFLTPTPQHLIFLFDERGFPEFLFYFRQDSCTSLFGEGGRGRREMGADRGLGSEEKMGGKGKRVVVGFLLEGNKNVFFNEEKDAV